MPWRPSVSAIIGESRRPPKNRMIVSVQPSFRPIKWVAGYMLLVTRTAHGCAEPHAVCQHGNIARKSKTIIWQFAAQTARPAPHSQVWARGVRWESSSIEKCAEALGSARNQAQPHVAGSKLSTRGPGSTVMGVTQGLLPAVCYKIPVLGRECHRLFPKDTFR